MSELMLSATSVEQWQELVAEARNSAEHHLGEELESYLVFLLMRFTRRPEMMARILALDYLRGLRERGRLRADRLREVGDHCLLYSGLFPAQARRRMVRLSYFVDLGRSAYDTLGDAERAATGRMFRRIARAFVELMETLQSMRVLASQEAAIDPLNAIELWQDTGSGLARRTLAATTDAFPAPASGKPATH